MLGKLRPPSGDRVPAISQPSKHANSRTAGRRQTSRPEIIIHDETHCRDQTYLWTTVFTVELDGGAWLLNAILQLAIQRKVIYWRCIDLKIQLVYKPEYSVLDLQREDSWYGHHIRRGCFCFWMTARDLRVPFDAFSILPLSLSDRRLTLDDGELWKETLFVWVCRSLILKRREILPYYIWNATAQFAVEWNGLMLWDVLETRLQCLMDRPHYGAHPLH